METLVALIQQYGLLFVFFNVLMLQAGLPVPAYPTLIITGALAATGGASVPALVPSRSSRPSSPTCAGTRPGASSAAAC
jgi:membrane protein DedA with SNARE-associated domain